MTTPSVLQGWPVPALGDVANIETAFAPLVAAIEAQSVMYFDTVAARNAIILAPAKGMLAWVDAVGAFTFYTGSVWKVLGGLPAGVILPTIGATADVGFLLVDGTTYPNVQTLYPELWARLPASWKSGSSMVTADYRGRAVIGAGTGAGLTARTLGVANIGTETHQLTAGESGMPAHTPTASSTNTSTDHQHTYSSNTSVESGNHYHNANGGSGIVQAAGVPGIALGNGGSPALYVNYGPAATDYQQGAHIHPYSGTTNFANAGTPHNHPITVNQVAAVGAAGPHNNVQPSAVATWQIKAH